MLGRLFFPFLLQRFSHEHLRPRRPRMPCRHRGGGGFERAAQRLNVTAIRRVATPARAGGAGGLGAHRAQPPAQAHQRGAVAAQAPPSSCACCAPTWSATCRSWPPAPRGARAKTSAFPSPSMPTALPPGPWGALHDLVRQRLPLEIITDDQDFTQEWLRSGQVLGCVTTLKQALRGCEIGAAGRHALCGGWPSADFARKHLPGADAAQLSRCVVPVVQPQGRHGR